MNFNYFSRSRFISRFVLFFFCKYIHIHIFFFLCVCVAYPPPLRKQKKLRPKNAHCIVVVLCVFLAQVFEKDSDTHSYVLSLCVFYANKLSLSTKNSTIEHITCSFCCFFLAFCFIVHTGLFFLSLCRILLAKSYAFSSFLFCFLSPFLCCFCFGLMMMYMVCIL